MNTRPLLVRFWEKVAKGAPDECWEWRGLRRPSGYGLFSVKRKFDGAHRVSWSIHNGRPVPKGFVVLHSCDNPPCVNPNHLRVGTQGENLRDMFNKGRQPKVGGASVCQKGHPYTEENTYVWRGFRQCRTCRREHDRPRIEQRKLQRLAAQRGLDVLS